MDWLINFQKPQWHKLTNGGRLLSNDHLEVASSKCTVNIIDVTPQDHGIWKCLATEDPFSRTLSHAESGIEVFVASPYKLAMLERPSQIQVDSLINSSWITLQM